MRAIGLVLLTAVTLAGSTEAKTVVVRVSARDYQELCDHVRFKGTSITIAGVDLGRAYDLMLDEADLAAVRRSGLSTEIVVPDLDGRKCELAFDGQYNSYQELTGMMRDLAAGHSDICALESIGPSYGGRWIFGLKISDNPSIEENEPEVLFFGQIHGNEWAAGQVCRHLMDTLVENCTTDPGFQGYVNTHQTWVFPVVNVDAFSEDYPAQNWLRKNRQPFGGGDGTDLNRNFGGGCNGNRFDDWGALVPGSNSAHTPSSAVFLGAYGGWTTEAGALEEFFRQRTFVASISFHTSGEIVVWPFGSGHVPADSAYYADLATQMAAQISRLDSGYYGLAPGTTLYPMNGGSEDWMYGWAHAIGGFPCMSFVVELGTEGYQPAADLDKIQTEAFHGAWVLMNRSDSIIADLEGMVPRPVLAPMDTSADGQFLIHWTPTRPEHNHPDRWALEELQSLTVVDDGFENGAARWLLQGFTVTADQHHSGDSSLWSGIGYNICNYAVTRDPYPVQSGDTLGFWMMHELEDKYDVGVAEVSLDGREWLQLDARYSGSSDGWVRRAYSLERWAGKSVYIRFRVMSDESTNRAGLYIDDVWPVPAFAARRAVDTTIADTAYAMEQPVNGRYWYRVRGHNTAWGWSDYGPLEDIVVGPPGIAQATPSPGSTEFLGAAASPFTGEVRVSYALTRPGNVEIAVFEAAGRQVRRLVGGQQPGLHQLSWDGRDAGGRKLVSGVYFVRMRRQRDQGIKALSARVIVAK